MFQDSQLVIKHALESKRAKIPPTMPKSKRLPPPTSTLQETAAPTDEDWVRKQCESFSKWLNYTFQPGEDKDYEVSMEEKQSGSKDRMALRSLVLHQRMAQARIKPMMIFQGDKM